jgi:hypothetical protein
MTIVSEILSGRINGLFPGKGPAYFCVVLGFFIRVLGVWVRWSLLLCTTIKKNYIGWSYFQNQKCHVNNLVAIYWTMLKSNGIVYVKYSEKILLHQKFSVLCYYYDIRQRIIFVTFLWVLDDKKHVRLFGWWWSWWWARSVIKQKENKLLVFGIHC